MSSETATHMEPLLPLPTKCTPLAIQKGPVMLFSTFSAKKETVQLLITMFVWVTLNLPPTDTLLQTHQALMVHIP